MVMEEDMIKENELNKIGIVIHPFLFRQSVKVYHNGEVTHVEQVPIQEVAETIERLSNEYVVNEVDIGGPVAFTKRVKDKLFDATTFNKNLKVNIY